MIHPRVLKELAGVLATPLATLFNVSPTNGKVPTQWKTATVIPIFKKGKRTDPANYRPVSLTSVLSKVMERILSEDITKHLKNNALMSADQHGFAMGKSTVTNTTGNIWN